MSHSELFFCFYLLLFLAHTYAGGNIELKSTNSRSRTSDPKPSSSSKVQVHSLTDVEKERDDLYGMPLSIDEVEEPMFPTIRESFPTIKESFATTKELFPEEEQRRRPIAEVNLIRELCVAYEDLMSSVFDPTTSFGIESRGFWFTSPNLFSYLLEQPDNRANVESVVTQAPELYTLFKFPHTEATIKLTVTDSFHFRAIRVADLEYQLKLTDTEKKKFWRSWSVVYFPGQVLYIRSPNGEIFDIANSGRALSYLFERNPSVQRSDNVFNVTVQPDSDFRHDKPVFRFTVRFDELNNRKLIFCEDCKKLLIVFTQVNMMLMMQQSLGNPDCIRIPVFYEPVNSRTVSYKQILKRLPNFMSLKKSLDLAAGEFGASLKKVKFTNVHILGERVALSSILVKIFIETRPKVFRFCVHADSKRALVYAWTLDTRTPTLSRLIFQFLMTWESAIVPDVLKINKIITPENAVIKGKRDPATGGVAYSITNFFRFDQYDM